MAFSRKRFEEAEGKYLEGRPLSDADRHAVCAALRSKDLRVVCIACGALLRDEHSSLRQREAARHRLREMCRKATSHSEKVELSITLLLIPFQEIDHPQIKRCVFSMMKWPYFTLRANALSVLERFAHRGNERARRLIEDARQDTHDVVRNKAIAILHRIA